MREKNSCFHNVKSHILKAVSARDTIDTVLYVSVMTPSHRHCGDEAIAHHHCGAGSSIVKFEAIDCCGSRTLALPSPETSTASLISAQQRSAKKAYWSTCCSNKVDALAVCGAVAKNALSGFCAEVPSPTTVDVGMTAAYNQFLYDTQICVCYVCTET